MNRKKNAAIQATIYMIIVLLVAFAVLMFVRNELSNDETQTIKADMISIQCMAKVYKGEESVTSNSTSGNSSNEAQSSNNSSNTQNNNSSNTNDANSNNPNTTNSSVKTNEVIGEKLSDCNNEIINEFKAKNIIDESDYDKYYVLTNDDLDALKAYVKNQPNSYYLINYETYEVIITKGYNGCYKLSEILNLE